jgi:hypothetical protein
MLNVADEPVFQNVADAFADMRDFTMHGFDRVTHELRDLRGDMDARFKELRGDMDKRFGDVDKRFDGLETRMDTRFERIERKLDRVLATRPSRTRPSRRKR